MLTDRYNVWLDFFHDRYHEAEPFPHCVIDGFLPDDIAKDLYREFPPPGAEGWRRYHNVRERKLEMSDPEAWPQPHKAVIAELNSEPFCRFLSDLTDLEVLPDPAFTGAGLHQIEMGGVLDVHVDFNRHPTLARTRKVNLLLYLNPVWDESWGGHLELWDVDRMECAERLDPVLNRCVIFTASERSYHGHPEPLNAPPGVNRQSIALYYYVDGIDDGNDDHTTTWLER